MIIQNVIEPIIKIDAPNFVWIEIWDTERKDTDNKEVHEIILKKVGEQLINLSCYSVIQKSQLTYGIVENEARINNYDKSVYYISKGFKEMKHKELYYFHPIKHTDAPRIYGLFLNKKEV